MILLVPVAVAGIGSSSCIVKVLVCFDLAPISISGHEMVFVALLYIPLPVSTRFAYSSMSAILSSILTPLIVAVLLFSAGCARAYEEALGPTAPQ